MSDYQKQQVEAIKAANELQDKANELQQKMITEIETNNNVTSKHNKAIRWLTVAIVALGILTIWANWKQTGRYAIAQIGKDSAFILDTKKSKLRIRGLASGNAYLGTNKNPKLEISLESEDKQKE